MKLLVVSSFYFPEKGGPCYRIQNMCEELHRAGIDVDVLTNMPNYPSGKIFKKYLRKFFLLEKVKNISVYRFWVFPSNSSKPIIRVFSQLTYLIGLILFFPAIYFKKYDKIYVQSPPLIVAYLTLLLAKIHKTKVVVNVSDLWPEVPISLGIMKKDSRTHKLFTYMESYIYQNSSAVITQSDEAKRYILSKFPKKRVLTYFNLSSDLPIKQNIDPKKYKLIYAGTLGLPHGILDVCKNIDFNRLDIEFHIFGDGNERENIQEYIHQNPNCNVFYHGTKSKKDMDLEYQKYHFSLVSLKWSLPGSLPSKIFTSVANFLPIIYIGKDSSSALIEYHDIGKTVSHTNLEKFEECIQEIRIPENYNKFINNMASLNSNEFNYQKNITSLIKFLNQ